MRYRSSGGLPDRTWRLEAGEREVRYKIVLLQTVEGRQVRESLDLTDDNLLPELGARGFRQTGTYKAGYSQRAEFLNQPTFEGLAGPEAP
jgi:hypothetical protein